MANMPSTGIDAMAASWFSEAMLRSLDANLFSGEVGRLVGVSFDDEYLKQEADMPQMQPKELLVHLEKGDRTEEFLDPAEPRVEGIMERGPMPPSNDPMGQFDMEYMRQLDPRRTRDMSQMQNQQRVFGTSAGRLGNTFLGGGPLR